MLAQAGFLLQLSGGVLKCIEAGSTRATSELAVWCQTSPADLPDPESNGWQDGVGSCTHAKYGDLSSRRVSLVTAEVPQLARVCLLLIPETTDPGVMRWQRPPPEQPPLVARPAQLLI
jgi:hypothetical protein